MAADRAARYLGMAVCELIDSLLVLALRANGKLRVRKERSA